MSFRSFVRFLVKKLFFILVFFGVANAGLVNVFTEEEKEEWFKQIEQKSPEHIHNVEFTALSFAYFLSENLPKWYVDNLYQPKPFKLSDFKPLDENVIFSKQNELITQDKKPCMKIEVKNNELIITKLDNMSEICKDAFDYYKLKNTVCGKFVVEHNAYYQKDKNSILTGDLSKSAEDYEDYSVCPKYDLGKNDKVVFSLSKTLYPYMGASMYAKLKELKEEHKNKDLKLFFDKNLPHLVKSCVKLEDNKIILNKLSQKDSKDEIICYAFLTAFTKTFGNELIKNGSFDMSKYFKSRY